VENLLTDFGPARTALNEPPAAAEGADELLDLVVFALGQGRLAAPSTSPTPPWAGCAGKLSHRRAAAAAK
jgi:hypothetical protein